LLASYASRHGRALVDRALYLPREWTFRTPRRQEARIPDTVKFTTKPKQALAMLKHAKAAGLLFAWITGDSVYGADRAIRRWAERHRRGYVLTVTSAQRLGLRTLSERIEDLPAEAWQRLSAGEGTKGPRLYDWARLEHLDDWARLEHLGGAAGFRCALLVRRSIAKLAEVTFYLTHAPRRPHWMNWSAWPACAGASKTCSSRPKGRLALTKPRPDPGSAGTDISPWRCSPWPISVPSARALSGGQDLATDLLPVTVPEIRRLLL
jgi:hypothetical protein